MSESESKPTAAELRQSILAAVGLAGAPTGIFVVPFAATHILSTANGSSSAAAVTKQGWREAIHALGQGALAERIVPEPNDAEVIASEYTARGLTPIALAHFHYDTPQSGYRDRILSAATAGDPIPTPHESPEHGVETRRLFSAAPLLKNGYDVLFPLPPVQYGLSGLWILPRTLHFTNAGTAENLQIDPGDGGGFRSVEFDREIPVTYPEPGAHTARVRATVDGETFEAAFTLDVSATSAPPPNDTWQLTAGSQFGNVTGHAWVYYGQGHSSLVNPLIISEGFPGGYTLDQLWAVLNEQSFISNVLATGYDVIILGYTNGTIALENNAGVAIAAIGQAIASRTGSSPLTVGGASMGGLITRYALTYMENQGIPHETALYFSFDSPHLGASVPPSVMYFLSYFASESDFIQQANALIISAAAQELLLYSLPAYNQNMLVPSPLRTTFVTNLQNLGNWPTQPRKIGVSNGDGTGTANGTAPSAEALTWSAYLNWVGANLYTSPGVDDDSNTNVVAQLWYGRTSYYSWAQGTTQFDNAPGGTSTFFQAITDGLTQAGYTNNTLYYPLATFMPAISGCALSQLDPLTQAGLFFDINSGQSPSDLDAYTASQENDPHVTVTPYLAQWLLTELQNSAVLK